MFKSIFGDRREAGKKPNHEGAQKDAEVRVKARSNQKYEDTFLCSFKELINSVTKGDKDIFRMLLLHMIAHRHSNQVRTYCTYSNHLIYV